jgi:exopolysaccharide production protein ExoY
MIGLWQVSGRNKTTYRRRVALDVAFSRYRSFKLYWRILLATVPAVLLSDGALKLNSILSVE